MIQAAHPVSERPASAIAKITANREMKDMRQSPPPAHRRSISAAEPLWEVVVNSLSTAAANPSTGAGDSNRAAALGPGSGNAIVKNDFL
jgi:hypothetical protein